MVSRSEDPSYSYADCLTYSLAGDTVYVSSDLSEELCSSADITKSAGTVAEMFSDMTGITGIKTEVVPSAQDDNVIYDEGDIVIPSDDPEDYYSVIPMPNIPKEILEQSHKKESEQTSLPEIRGRVRPSKSRKSLRRIIPKTVLSAFQVMPRRFSGVSRRM